MELVRYIHLNPLRAKLVDSLSQLGRYEWGGHSVILGKFKKEWQDDEYVLKCFGGKLGEARGAYRHYVSAGVEQGQRPDLAGAGQEF
jgi:putative transposase